MEIRTHPDKGRVWFENPRFWRTSFVDGPQAMSRLTTPYKIAYVPIPLLFGIADNFLANCYLQSELNKIDRLIFTLNVKGVRHMMLHPIIISELLTLLDVAPPPLLVLLEVAPPPVIINKNKCLIKKEFVKNVFKKVSLSN